MAEKGELLVFVEVRTRQSALFGTPQETVTAGKQRRIIAAARDFLARWRGPERGARFDVIGVLDAPEGPKLTHLPAAFDVSSYY